MKKVKRSHRSLLFVISLLCISINYGQEEAANKKKPASEIAEGTTLPDSLKRDQKYGIRAGIGLDKLIRTSFDKNYQGFEIVADYRFYRNFYAALEIGNENLTKKLPRLTTNSKGSYLKVGVDYNAFKNWPGMQNLIYVGGRYGRALFSQSLDNFIISSNNLTFGLDERTSAKRFTDLNASWIELIIGTKVELFNSNLFLGLSVALKRYLSQDEPDNFGNLFIPGFGKTNDLGKIGVGYSYTISYLLPLYKKNK